jgi:hypothetical protein
MTDLPLTLSCLLRADLTVAAKNARTLIIGGVMGLLVIVSTRSVQAHQFGGHAYAVGVATAVTLMTTAILGYAMSMGRDRESGVLRRLQITPAPGWAIIASPGRALRWRLGCGAVAPARYRVRTARTPRGARPPQQATRKGTP